MEAVDLIGLLVPATYLAMLAVESRWPARAFPPRKGWRWLGIGFLLLIGTAGATVPLVLPLDWMAAHRWMDGTRLGAAGGALAGYIAAFHGMFQHWNVRTPRWLGYFIQRPESHCVHHRMGVHTWNYADFPLWDIVFGSFRNPRAFRGACGFEAPDDRRVAAMLGWRDVNAPRYGERNRGARRGTPTLAPGELA